MKNRILLTGFLIIICIISFAALFVFRSTHQVKMNEEKNEKAEALESLRFLSESRAYPDKDIPEDGYGKAYDFYKTNFLNDASKVAQTSSQWQAIGPINGGGRTIGIAIDPNDTAIVWLGAASGGLWKSTTGGTGTNAWTNVPIGFPVLGVSSIAINPTNSNIMFIGTGETYDYGSSVNGIVRRTTRGSNGIGILKSIDGGVTWTQSLNWNYKQRRGVWDVIMNPKNPKVIYAATTEGVFKSNNNGASWNNVLPQLMVMDLEMDANDTNIVYAGVGNLTSANKGLYKTNNSGATWSILSNGLPPNTQGGRISIATYPLNPRIVMCMVADSFNTVGIYRSTNQGATWTNMLTSGTNVVSYQGWYAHCLMMAANDSSHVFAGGVNLFESFDSGITMNQIASTNIWSDFHGLISNPLDPNKIYALTDIGLFRSDDLGQTFYDCLDGYNVSQMYMGSVSSTDSTIALAGLQDHNTQRYNGTLYWDAVVGGDGSFSAIDPFNDFVQFASSQYLNISSSFDQGFNFFQSYNSPSNPAGNNPTAFIAPFVLSPSNDFILYGGALGIIKSIDQGGSWNPIGPVLLDNGNKIISIAVSNTNSDTLYCATSPGNLPSHVYRSSDGGTTFTNISAGLPNRYPRDITINPNNSEEVYLTYSGFGTGHIFKSINAGVSWIDISTTLPNLPFHCLAIDPLHTDTIIAGCDFGVFISPDKGVTWFAYNSGLPEAVMVFDLEYSPSDRNMVAFTFGHGAYKIALDQLSVDVKNISDNVYEKIYPNPVKDILNIEIASSHPSKVEMFIYDLSGKIILNKLLGILNPGKNNFKINCSSLNNGIYFIKTLIGEKVVVKKIFVEN